jgi:hypothetical protein
MKNLKKLLVKTLTVAVFTGFAIIPALANGHQQAQAKETNNVYTIDSYDSKKEIYDAENSTGHIKFKIDVVDGMVSVDQPVGQKVEKEKDGTIRVLPTNGDAKEITTSYVTVTSIDKEYATGINLETQDDSYVLDKKDLQVGDTLEVKENKYGEILDVQKKKYKTTLFLVESVTKDGMLNAVSVIDGSNYLLDNKYSLGDIVQVTYSHDDIIKEQKVTGKKYKSLEELFAGQINYLEDQGMIEGSK